MQAVNRRLAGVAAGAALVLGATAAVPAAASAETASRTPARATCGIAVTHSKINARWNTLGGANGWMGCPTSRTKDVYVRHVHKGKRQYFQHGTITWSPAQGRNMVVAAWKHRGHAYFNWGTTAPNRYDLFLVRYSSAAEPRGRQFEVRAATSGRVRVPVRTTGAYTFVTEGCDRNAWGTTCRQGWTLSAKAY